MKRDKLDSIEEIKKAAEINSHVLGDDPEAMSEASLRRFREETERKFHGITYNYEELCRTQGDDAATVNLAARLASIREHLYEIDRNLAFFGKPQFNREKVAGAMGWLIAYHEATVQTLELNERLNEA